MKSMLVMILFGLMGTAFVPTSAYTRTQVHTKQFVDGEWKIPNLDPLQTPKLNQSSPIQPLYAPDIERWARMTYATFIDNNWEIHTLTQTNNERGDTFTTTRNLSNAPFSTDTHPNLSPNADQVLFVSARDGNNEIYRVGFFGDGQARLTVNAASDTQPAWAPDSYRIAFASRRDGNWNIYGMNLAGGAQLPGAPALDVRQALINRACDRLRKARPREPAAPSFPATAAAAAAGGRRFH